MANDPKDSTELNEIRKSIDKPSITELDNIDHEQAEYSRISPQKMKNGSNTRTRSFFVRSTVIFCHS